MKNKDAIEALEIALSYTTLVAEGVAICQY